MTIQKLSIIFGMSKPTLIYKNIPEFSFSETVAVVKKSQLFCFHLVYFATFPCIFNIKILHYVVNMLHVFSQFPQFSPKEEF